MTAFCVLFFILLWSSGFGSVFVLLRHCVCFSLPGFAYWLICCSLDIPRGKLILLSFFPYLDAMNGMDIPPRIRWPLGLGFKSPRHFFPCDLQNMHACSTLSCCLCQCSFCWRYVSALSSLRWDSKSLKLTVEDFQSCRWSVHSAYTPSLPPYP